MAEILFEDTEKVLKLLLTLKRDEQNTVTIGIKRYGSIDGISPEQFIQCLSELEGDYVTLDFAGQRTPNTLCYVTLTRKALSYFADKEEETSEETWRIATKIIHTIILNPIKFIIGAIITAVIGVIITAIMA